MKTAFHRVLERRLWVTAYVFLLFSPLVLMLATQPRGAQPIVLFGIAIGFVAYVGLVLQLITPSRAPQFTAPIGIGPLLRLHRFMGLGMFLLVALHIGVFVVHEPEQFLPWLYPINGPAKAQFGWVAAAALLLIVISSVWRTRLRINYERWRTLHIALGVLIVAGGSVHVVLISWYSKVESLRWFTVLLLVVGMLALIYLRVGRPFAALGVPYVLKAVIPERGDATTLQLEAAGHQGVAYMPGQFAWLKLAGPWSVTEHPFSYASSAARPGQPSFTVKKLGDFTRHAGSLQPGMRVLVDGPHGAYEPALPDAGFVLVVGGVGITPAMSIIRTSADLHDPRPIRLIYGARTWDEITFREELLELERHMPLEIKWVLSNPDASWTGLKGFVNKETLAQTLPADADRRNYFVCGPPIMIDGVMDALHDLGIPDMLVYADRFDSA